MTDEHEQAVIVRRMDVVIMLLLECGPEGPVSMTSKIQKLLGFGLSTAEVAEIVRKKANYVTAVISSKKRAESRGKS